MHRIDGIGAYAPQNARDGEMWARLSSFVATTPDAFGRNPDLGHVTASAFVLSPDLKAVLLTHHTKLDRWLQLGGHCDGIKDACFSAHKEAYEESGLERIRLLGLEVFDVDIHEIPARGADPAHLHYDVRYLFVAEAGRPMASAESKALAYVALADLEQYTDAPSVLVLRHKLAGFLARVETAADL